MLRAWISDPLRPAPLQCGEAGPLGGGGGVAEPALSPLHAIRSAPDGWPRPATKAGEAALTISSPQTVGLAAGKWCPYGLDADQPGDQRDEAGGSLVFDTEPLDRAARSSRRAGAPPRCRIRQAERLRRRDAVGGVSGRRRDAADLRHPQPHAPRRPRGPEAARARQALPACASSSTNAARRSRPATGCGSRFRPPIGRSSGRRRNRRRSPSPPAPARSICRSARRAPKTTNCRPSSRPRTRRSCARRSSARARATSRMHTDIRTGRVDMDRYNDDGLTRIDDFDWEYGLTAHRVYSIRPDDPLSAEIRIRWTKEYGRDDFRVAYRCANAHACGADGVFAGRPAGRLRGRHAGVFTRVEPQDPARPFVSGQAGAIRINCVTRDR